VPDVCHPLSQVVFAGFRVSRFKVTGYAFLSSEIPSRRQFGRDLSRLAGSSSAAMIADDP